MLWTEMFEMFENFRECSRKFREHSCGRLAPRCGRRAPSSRLLLPLQLAQVCRCRHNSTDFGPAGKETCCSRCGMRVCRS